MFLAISVTLWYNAIITRILSNMAKITETTITSANQDRHNANKGTERGEAALDDSLTQFGAGRSLLLDKNGDLIAGNKTQKAAIKAGLTKMIVVETTGDEVVAVKRMDMDLSSTTDKRARQLAYYDNQVQALDYELDLEQLVIDLDNGVDLTGLWNEDEMAEMLEQMADGLLGGGEGEGEGDDLIEDEVPIDKAEELLEKWQCKEGDLWLIGEHRLIVGDCTDKATVERLLNGKKANVIFTSPPYAMQRKDQYGGVETDKYVAWWEGVQANARLVLADDGSFFVNIKPHSEDSIRVLYVFDLVIAMVRQWGWRFVDEFCWERIGMPGSPEKMGKFKNQFEPIYWFNVSDNYKFYPKNVMHKTKDAILDDNWKPSLRENQGSGDNALGDRLLGEGMAYPGNKLSISSSESLGHSAAFPVALPTFFIKAYSDPNDVIFDPFMGSGTTMAAAHNEGRIGVGTERLPKYCAVVLERMSLLGLTPELSKE